MSSEPKISTLAEQLNELAKLHANGVLNDEDFQSLKSKLISGTRVSNAGINPSNAQRQNRQSIRSKIGSTSDQMTISYSKSWINRHPVAILALAAIAVIGLGVFIFSPKLSDADLDAMKRNIKTEFEKRDGITVVQVEMERESSTKAIGFVKLRVPLLGEIMKKCSATITEGNRYIWECD